MLLFEEDWDELQAKSYFFRQSWTKYMQKVRKSGKTGRTTELR